MQVMTRAYAPAAAANGNPLPVAVPARPRPAPLWHIQLELVVMHRVALESGARDRRR